MINQVVVAGRLTLPPEPGPSHDSPSLDLVLEVEHTPWQGSPETCEVRVRLEGERWVEVGQRYLEADRHVVVHGHLRAEGEGWVVVAQRWEFLPRNVESNCLWDPSLELEPVSAGARH
ncbi:MAG: hypothetical protein KDD82_25235 [Planctomycetes bacterium]|nr:hypothetical protein [Planctomycetota bacterium]